MNQNIVNVGLIGCGEVAQVIHIPTLLHMSDWFKVTYLCDISPSALAHCKSKMTNPDVKTTHDAEELCGSPTVDLVMVINSDEYHVSHALLALDHDKHVLVEKPLSLTKKGILEVIEAEKMSKGKVMVGYMRRYATAFEDAVKEIGGLENILYARVRDIIGPNSFFVGQSGTFAKRFTDFSSEDSADKTARAKDQVETAFQEIGGLGISEDSTRMWRILGGLGSHDLSVMREALGMPERIVGSSLGFPFWNVLMKYPSFTVSYESGIDNIPRFDAHLEVYSANKTVRVQYDTPYIKGLPITMHITENVDGAYKECVIRKTYEDAYTLEMKQLWKLVVEGEPVKTTAQDALQDIELFGMVMKHGFGAVEKHGGSGP